MKIGIVTLSLISMFMSPLALAQETSPNKRPPIIPDFVQSENDKKLLIPTAGDKNPNELITGSFIPTLTKTVISFAGALAVLFIIIGGVQILTAYGDDGKVETAKKTITYAIIGLLIAMLSYAIVSIISGIQLGPMITPKK